MGMAMLMILAFHLSRGYDVFLFKSIFSRGFYGVDIFLFFSALGCSFSYNRNKLSKFYCNRAKRVLPLFYVLVCFRLLWALSSGDNLNMSDVLATITGFSYFKIFGGYWIDWYLCALLLLYGTFPLFFNYVRKYELGGVIFISVLSTILLLLVPMPWEHSCLLGRLTIFALGIMYYVRDGNITDTDMKIIRWLTAYGLFLLSVDLLLPNNRTRFLAPAFVAPLMIWLLAKLYEKLETRCSGILSCVEFLGKHSLEIYVANCMSMVICHQGLGLQGYTGVAIEICILGILSVSLFYLNRILTLKLG